ncbi:hypothetical protein KCU68_g2476, partial [Aureobasidium melanogenum]
MPNGAPQMMQDPNSAGPSNTQKRPVAGQAPRSNHALEEYQRQYMLLEQQNKKRLLMAHQKEDDTTDELKSPVPDDDDNGLNFEHKGQMFDFGSEQETIKVPLHQMASSSSRDRRRTRLRTRQISSQLTTHTHQSGSPNTAQSLRQSSAMSILDRPMILPGQPSQKPSPTYPQPTSQPGQQMDQTMARPRQWQLSWNTPSGSSAPNLDLQIPSSVQTPQHLSRISMPVTEQELQIFRSRIPAAQAWSHEQLRRNFMQWKYQQIQKQNSDMAGQIMNAKGQAQLEQLEDRKSIM